MRLRALDAGLPSSSPLSRGRQACSYCVSPVLAVFFGYDLRVLLNCLLPCISSSGFLLLMGRLVPPVSRGSPAPGSCRLACGAAGGAAGAGAGSLRRRQAGSPASLLPVLPPPPSPSATSPPRPPWPLRPVQRGSCPGPGAPADVTSACTGCPCRDPWLRRRSPSLLLLVRWHNDALRDSLYWTGGAHDPIRPGFFFSFCVYPPDDVLYQRVAGVMTRR